MKRTSGTFTAPDGTRHEWEQQALPLQELVLPANLWLRAANVGVARFVNARAAGKPMTTAADPRNRLANDVLGAVAECAVAQALNVYWAGEDTKPEYGGDLTLPIVGPAEVRATIYRDGALPVHEWEQDRPFVLVCDFGWSAGVGTMRCPGWIMGREAQDSRWWRTDWDVPAFGVPQSALMPLESLRRWTEGKGS